MNLKQIKEGWTNFFRGQKLDPRIRDIAQKRADICSGCEFYKSSAVYGVLNKLSAALTETVEINDVVGQYCGKCTCKFPQGWLSLEKSCPIDKWGAEQLSLE